MVKEKRGALQPVFFSIIHLLTSLNKGTCVGSQICQPLKPSSWDTEETMKVKPNRSPLKSPVYFNTATFKKKKKKATPQILIFAKIKELTTTSEKCLDDKLEKEGL